MKKLLSLLGAIVIGASASQAATSFSYGPSMKKYVDKEVKFYSEVSANAFKAGILADQNFTIKGQKNVGLDINYAANYYASQHILDVFPDLINPKQGAKPTATAEVSSLYESVFGTNQGGFDYTISNSYSSLKAAGNNAFDKNSRFGQIVNGTNESDNLKQPDTKTAALLSAAAGAANIVFKNDFSPSLATTVIGLLASNKIRDALNSDTISNIFNMVDNIVTKNDGPIRNVVASLTQTKIAQDAVAKNATYKDQLASSTESLFKSLIYLASPVDKTTGQKSKYNSDGAKDDAATAFWNMIAGTPVNDDYKPAKPFMKTVKGEDGTPKQVIDTDNLEELINSIAGITEFGITLLHYFRAFDEYTSKLANPIDGFHIFDDKLNNQEITEKVLNEKYVDIQNEDDFWYNENGTLTTKLNLQNLISDLEYYLCPTDTKGYSLLRTVAIVLGGTEDGFNPILETAINPLLKNDGILAGIISPLLKKIPDIPGVMNDNIRASLTASILKIAKQLLSQGVIDWITSDGDNPNSHIATNLINDISSLYGMINISGLLGSSVSDNVKTILSIVDAVVYYIRSGNGQQFLQHPWSTLYGKGMLVQIGNIVQNVGGSSELARRIGYALANLKDIRTILTMNISSLISNIGIMVKGSALEIPDFLYHAKDLSISNIIQMLATDWLTKNDKASNEAWTTNRYNSLKQNSHYAFNTGAIGELVESLIPATDDDKTKTIVSTDQAGANRVSIVEPLYLAIKYFGTSTSVSDQKKFQYWVKLYDKTTGKYSDPIQILNSDTFKETIDNSTNTVVVSNNALEDLLGVKTVNNTPAFISGSLLGSVSRLYGHGYVDKDNKPVEHEEMFNGSASLFSLFTMFSQFATDSVKELVKDNYAKYFDPKNWVLTNEKQKNLDNDKPDANTVQTLSYDIKYHNPDSNKWFTYHIEMHRQAVDTSNTSGGAFTGWVLDQLLRQN